MAKQTKPPDLVEQSVKSVSGEKRVRPETRESRGWGWASGKASFEKVTFEQRPEGSEGVSHGDCRGKLVPGGKNSSCAPKWEQVRVFGGIFKEYPITCWSPLGVFSDTAFPQFVIYVCAIIVCLPQQAVSSTG